VHAARIGDWIMDPAARGNVSYTNTANVSSFQQDGVFTYRGWQYTAWYRGDRRAVIARRHLPDGRLHNPGPVARARVEVAQS